MGILLAVTLGLALAPPPRTAGFGLAEQPRRWRVSEGAPNPFTLGTTVRFRTTASGRVCLDVIDLLGRRVRSLADGWRSPGAHAATRDGRDDLGTQLPAGIYWLRVSLGHRAVARRVLRLR